MIFQASVVTFSYWGASKGQSYTDRVMETVLGVVLSLLEWPGQSLDVSISDWGGADSIHEWLSVTILLWVLWQLDQTMAAVRYRVQPE